MFYLNIHKLVGSKSARQFLYPLSFFKQKRNIAESNIPLGMFPFSIGLQKFKVHFPKRQEQQIGRTSQLMHDEHAALTKHFARVSHQKIECDILGEISGYDAIKFSLQNHLFCSSMNKFDIGQFPSLFSRNAQIFLVEFHACTKSADLALMRGFAQALAATGVTVNAVLPGPTRTEGVDDMFRSMGQSAADPKAQREFIDKARPSSIIKRLEQPEEIAEVVAFLVSREAAAISGSPVRADGGVVLAIT